MSIELEFKKKAEEILKLSPEERHSYFQLQHFVIGSEPTIQGQLWQCLREIKARRDSIEALESQIGDLKDEAELIDIQKEKLKNKPKTKLLEKEKKIRERQLARKKISIGKNITKLEKTIEYVYQEGRFLIQMFEALNKIEKIKDFDDIDAQKEYWNEKIAEELNFKLLLRQPIDTKLAQTIMRLNDDSPVKVEFTKTLKHVKDHMEKLEQKKLIKENNAENIEQR